MAFEIAALIELALVVLESLGVVRSGLLPLGGGNIQQIGILFAAAFIIERSIALRRKE